MKVKPFFFFFFVFVSLFFDGFFVLFCFCFVFFFSKSGIILRFSSHYFTRRITLRFFLAIKCLQFLKHLFVTVTLVFKNSKETDRLFYRPLLCFFLFCFFFALSFAFFDPMRHRNNLKLLIQAP